MVNVRETPEVCSARNRVLRTGEGLRASGALSHLKSALARGSKRRLK